MLSTFSWPFGHLNILEKCLFRSIANFSIRWWLFCYSVVWGFLYSLNVNLLSDTWFANIFCHSVNCSYILLTVSFWHSEAFKLGIVPSVYRCIVACDFSVIFKKSLPRPMSISIFPKFSSRSFMVSGLTFRSSIHFNLIFVSSIDIR